MDIGPTELILILVIVVILFGVGRIGKLGKELGSGIRGFKEGLQSNDEYKEEVKDGNIVAVQQSALVDTEQQEINSQAQEKEPTHEPRTN